MRSLGGALALVLGLMPVAGARVQSAPEEAQAAELVALELRVISLTASGGLVIDRGSRDGVAVGDGLWLGPKGGTPREGRVVKVFEREAEVELVGAGSVPSPGTKGLVWVAPVVADVAGLGSEDQVETVEAEGTGESSETEDEGPERPRWARPDDGWDASQPLLARVRAEHPDERPRVIGGRVYAVGGGSTTLDGKRGNGYLRSGMDSFVLNPFGRGGQLDLDVDLDVRSTWVPADDGQDDGHGRLRFDELAYSWGGTRFEPESHQVGRFLLRTTPEFGRLDGYEWTRRLPTGDRFGASAGYLVEDGFDAATGHELGFQGFYRWVPDQRERIGVTGAVQKTFRNGARDRDRLLLKGDAGANSGLGPWALHGSIAYDLHSSEDNFETDDGEFSRAWLQAWRDFDSVVLGRRDDLAMSYRHEGYVQTLGSELPPLYAAGLVAERSDRVGVNGGFWMAPDQRLFYAGGLWKDSDEGGMDVEAGLGFEDLGKRLGLAKGGHGDLRLFASNGRSSSTVGFGASYGRAFEDEAARGWDLSYELLWNDRLGFTTAVDTSTQHRLRYLVDLGRFGAWRLAGNADMVIGGSDVGLSTGFFLTRSF